MEGVGSNVHAMMISKANFRRLGGKSRDRAHPVIQSFARKFDELRSTNRVTQKLLFVCGWTSSSETNKKHFTETGSEDST